MKKDYSFKTRLLLSFWALLLLALLLPPWYYYRILAREIIDESKQNAIQKLDLIQRMLSHEKALRSVEDLQRWLVEVGKQPGVRLTYVAEGGRVFADSQVTFSEIPNLENHAGRPEIIEAQSQAVGVTIRFSGTVQEELIYVAKKVPGQGGIPPGVLRLAAPFSAVKEALDRLKNSFPLFLALISAVAAFFSYALIRRLNKPILELIDATEAISTRDFKRRIRSSPGHEFYPLTQSINKMAENIEKDFQTITDQKQQLEAVFNAMQEGVMVLDSGGRIRSFNQTFSMLLPNVTKAIIGRRPLEVILSAELQKLCDRIVSPGAGDEDVQPQRLQIVLGEERTYDVSAVRPPDRQEGIGAVIVFHDISELKRLEKVRQDFVANVSHELRTPLTSIKGYAETLLAETPPGPETTASFLQIISKNANHMAKMVEDLLQLARLDAHQKSVEFVPVDAAAALLTALRACSPQADAKGLRLENNMPETGIMVSGDFDQLVQVFRNLLENAVRYSPPGEAITISCEERGEIVTFSVRDEGPGIPREHQFRIFERFYRIEKHRSDHWGSTGLGLAICRHIVRSHGGRIWVQSPNIEEKKGTTFFFTLLKAEGEMRNEE
ncbi:MAG: ATP-binding protein [Syntrophobacteraceae bacterium]